MAAGAGEVVHVLRAVLRRSAAMTIRSTGGGQHRARFQSSLDTGLGRDNGGCELLLFAMKMA